MAVTRVASAVYTPPTGSGGAVTSRTVTVPTIQDGDLILLFAVKAGGSSNVGVSGLTGLTLLADNAFTGHSSSVYYKANAAASDSGTVITVTTATALRASVILVVYRGAATTAPIDVYATQNGNPTTNSTAPTATSTVSDVRVDFVAGSGNNASVSYTAAAGMTKAAESIDTYTAGDAFGAVFEKLTAQAASVASGANVYVGTASSTNTGWTLLIKVKTASNTVRPSSQISNAGAFTVTGEATLVAALADELDSSFAASPVSPTGATFELKFDELNPTGNVTASTTMDLDSGTTGTLTLTLKQGSTTIATWADTITTTKQTFTHTTTSGQTATITDRNDLRLFWSVTAA